MISKYTESLKTYGYSTLGGHIFAFICIFPYLAFCITITFFIFYVSFLYCSLINEIEESTRAQLVSMIDSCDSGNARDNLIFQLYMHDKYATFGTDQDFLNGLRI